MSSLRLGFTERRRRGLALKVDRLDRLESRSTVTPFSAFSLAAGAFQGLAQIGRSPARGGVVSPGPVRPQGTDSRAAARPSARPITDPSRLSIAIAPPGQPAGGGASTPDPSGAGPAVRRGPPDLAESLTAGLHDSHASTGSGISAPWKPATRPGGGAALPPRGGSGGGAQSATVAAIQGHAPRPRASAPPALPPTIPGALTASPPTGPTTSLPAPVITRNGPAQGLQGGTGTGADAAPGGDPSSGATGSSTIPENPSSLPYGPTEGPIESPLVSFPYYPLYTLDYIQGNVLFPGGYQLATLDGNVDLRAQVQGNSGVTFSWNTTNLTHATSIITSGTGNYDLTFTWDSSNATAAVDSVTLTASVSGSDVETQTYDFEVPAGSVYSKTGTAAWPTSLSPDTVSPNADSWSSDGVSVDANSGALDTTLALPTYNPNVPGLALTYDSLTADPRPIVVVPHILSGTQAVPTAVNATLTFGTFNGTTWYYNTSQFTPGDLEQIALQANATTFSTGRYSYSAQVVDERSTNTTTTYTGTATVLNETTSAFGDGWTLQGLEQITSATGGVILAVGGGSTSLWFSGSPGVGGNYTTPAGDFSTLTKTSSGYTRTLTDGTQLTFNSSGYQTASIDRNALHTTYSYNGYNQLITVEDPYTKLTTFTYASGGGALQTIQDPALRLTTLTYTGTKLTGVQQADGSHLTYTYDSAGRMTQATDPNGNAVTVSYDSAERVGTITRPDSTTEQFSAYQEQGWTNSGTSGSPAAATLLAVSASGYTDPNTNLTQLRPDWYGLGTTGQVTDALGDVTTYDVNSNGLPTISIDRLDRISQYTYDTLGNMTEDVYPDGYFDQYTYNSDSEPLTSTNARGYTTSYTYDSHGNNTVIQDPLNNLTTMTYTTHGKLQSTTDANNHTTTELYDTQDRVTTVQFPDGTTNLYAYNTQGNAIKITDGRNNATTYSYDALNRETGTTDALGNHTTFTLDANGNVTKDQEPTPAGQTARTTTYAYDSLNRLTTVTDPLGYQTVSKYDADGNETSVKDPMNRITTTVYDALNRPTAVIDPMGYHTTTAYDAEGQALTVTDPMNRVTTYAYSVRGWVSMVTDPMSYIATYIYSPTGQTTAEDQYLGGQQIQSAGYSYDADDRMTTYSDGLGHDTTDSYDGVGNRIAVEDANGNTTTYSYDSMNRLTTITDAMEDTTVYGYDHSGNPQTVTDGLGHTTTTLYDALDRATTTIGAIGGITTIAYDVASRETSLTDPAGNTTTWAYDADDRLTTLTEPNSHTVTYLYDNDGELTDTTDEDGRRTTYSYDADGDQTGETWVGASPAEKITYTYDADNEMTGAADAFATLTFTYNRDGQLQTGATSGPGTGQPAVTLTYAYDQLGDETSVTDSLSSQGIATYSYDIAQRMTTIATSYGGTTGPEITYTYDGADRLTNLARSIGGGVPAVDTDYSYDNADRVVTISHYLRTTNGHSGYMNTPLATYVYSYDNANRVTSEQDAEGTATFTYDHADELTAVGGSRTESYSYDLNGNRTGTGYHTTVMNELTNEPGHTYTYDNAGNMISDNNGTTITTYTYDYHNRLTEVTVGGTIEATYTYDALDRRIGVKDSGTQTWTVYDGTSADAQPYADFNGSGSLTERYLSGPGVVDGAVVDVLLARTSASGSTAWYLPDNLGSVRDLADTSGNELDHVVYDSFGNIVTETNATNGDRFKFAGMEYDSTTGQNYDRARYYDAAIGRFMSEDPTGFAAGDANLFRYVGNSVVGETDPSGLVVIPPGPIAQYLFYVGIHSRGRTSPPPPPIPGVRGRSSPTPGTPPPPPIPWVRGRSRSGPRTQLSPSYGKSSGSPVNYPAPAVRYPGGRPMLSPSSGSGMSRYPGGNPRTPARSAHSRGANAIPQPAPQPSTPSITIPKITPNQDGGGDVEPFPQKHS